MATPDSKAIERWARWVNAWTALSLPGVGLAILTWGPATVAGIVAAAAVPVALVLAVVEHDRRREATRPRGEAGGWIGRVGLCAVTFVLSMMAVAPLLPAVAFLLLGLAGATTPLAADLRRRVVGQAIGPTGSHPETVEPITPLRPSPGLAEAAREMTDAELCRAWRDSFWTLREARNPLARMSVVLQRQCFLDELEARHAAAVEAWLASGDRPCGGPERFLKNDGGDQGHQPTAA